MFTLRQSNRYAFTLIEMLVVIAIIALLAAMLFPAINSALLTAKKNKAKGECESIAQAVTLYYNDYNQMPVPFSQQGYAAPSSGFGEEQSKQDMDNDSWNKGIIKVLIAEDDTLNPKKKVYLSMDKPTSDGTFQDPWRKQYKIKLDLDFNGKVEYYSDPNQHRTRAVVVSTGKNGKREGADGDDLSNVDIVNK